MNATKHGLRSQQSHHPVDLPDWIRAIEAELVCSLEPMGHRQREQLNRLLAVLVLIDRVDRLITAEFDQVFAGLDIGRGQPGDAHAQQVAAKTDTSNLRKLIAYRKRFRAQRDMCLRRIIRGDVGARDKSAG